MRTHGAIVILFWCFVGGKKKPNNQHAIDHHFFLVCKGKEMTTGIVKSTMTRSTTTFRCYGTKSRQRWVAALFVVIVVWFCRSKQMTTNMVLNLTSSFFGYIIIFIVVFVLDANLNNNK
jgi:hypothetical protein